MAHFVKKYFFSDPDDYQHRINPQSNDDIVISIKVPKEKVLAGEFISVPITPDTTIQLQPQPTQKEGQWYRLHAVVKKPDRDAYIQIFTTRP